MNTRDIGNGLAALAVVSALALTGCESTTDDHEEEHAEPEGVELVMGGRVIASYDGDDQSWSGGLEVGVGEQTDRIDVRFVDHDGDEVELEDELYLEVDSGDDSVAAFRHTGPGQFSGTLEGVGEGQTGLSFKLMHGEVGSGHPDFVTMPITARVLGRS